MAKKECNEQAKSLIVNPALDELDQLRQTTEISDTCAILLPEHRDAAVKVARVLYPKAFEGEKGGPFKHNGQSYQGVITRTYHYPKKSRNQLTNLQLQQLHMLQERMAALMDEKKHLTQEIAVLKGKLNPKMKLESITYSISVKRK